jgi:hypothetical protein
MDAIVRYLLPLLEKQFPERQITYGELVKLIQKAYNEQEIANGDAMSDIDW